MREYLTDGEGILLRGLIWVFMDSLVEAGHAAVQQLQVTLVQTVHGAPAHTPVKVVHSLSLQQSTVQFYQ